MQLILSILIFLLFIAITFFFMKYKRGAEDCISSLRRDLAEKTLLADELRDSADEYRIPALQARLANYCLLFGTEIHSDDGCIFRHAIMFDRPLRFRDHASLIHGICYDPDWDIDKVLRMDKNLRSAPLLKGVRYGLEGIISPKHHLMGDEADYIMCYVDNLQDVIDLLDVMFQKDDEGER